METKLKELLDITGLVLARQQVIEAALMQLIEQQVKPDAASAQRFADGLRKRVAEALTDQSDTPHAPTEEHMTLLLAALLESAGHAPQR